MNISADKERRAVKRWDINCPARIRLRYKNSVKNFECVVGNLDFKGFRARLKKELPPLEALKLTVIFPNSGNFTAKCEVAWKQVLPDGILYGFNIIAMKDSERNLLYQLINSSHFPDLVKLWWKDVR